nr:glycosyltransferase [uncultured Methanobacterium sp.]
MPRVSVIMPSYNHEKYIKDSISSILKQTFNDFELIIIDDASIDNSRDIINFFLEKDHRLKVKFHQKNLGTAKTINDALKISKGDFIAFTSSDDIWLPHKLQTQMKVLNENDELIVWSDGQLINKNNELLGKTFLELHNAMNKKKNGNLFESLLSGNYIFGTTRILKRDNIKNIEFDGQFKHLNDYKFEVDIARKFKYHFIPESLAYYRWHQDNTVSSKKRECEFEDILIREYFLENYGEYIHKNTKWNIYNRLRQLYSYFGDKKKSRYYLRESFNADMVASVKYFLIEIPFNVLKSFI